MTDPAGAGLHARHQAGIAGHMSRGGEAADVTDFRPHHQAEYRTDTRDRLQPHRNRIGGGHRLDLRIHGCRFRAHHSQQARATYQWVSA